MEAELEAPSFLGSAWDCEFYLPPLPQAKTDVVILASHGHPVGVRGAVEKGDNKGLRLIEPLRVP